MSGPAEPIRTRLLSSLVTALGVTLLAAGLLSYASPITAGYGEEPTPTPTATVGPTALLTLPPLTSASPSASTSMPADRRPSRIRIVGLGIDLPVVAPGGPNDYPLCNVAMWFGSMDQPGSGGATYLYAHARTGMFLPLLDASKVSNGSAMLGMIVEVWTTDDQRFLYEISQIRRHVPYDQGLDLPMAAKTEQLWLQTSEGPAVPKGQTPNPKLQIVARFLSSGSADDADANPTPHPVVCG